jgi:hypothetical protein
MGALFKEALKTPILLGSHLHWSICSQHLDGYYASSSNQRCYHQYKHMEKAVQRTSKTYLQLLPI